MLEKLIVVTSFKLRRTPETLKEIIGIIFEILITNKLDNHLSLRLKILLLWVVIPVCEILNSDLIYKSPFEFL
ncbi:hypothetical protein RIR_jg25125.t1 [Rhizophagus irregularis DAOM 181602=DAOM 197198]|nr:hypothetical protein RIR_jg25125.t1 [Rhizophagus irregularis DAOM 181602=DAOM 197198]